MANSIRVQLLMDGLIAVYGMERGSVNGEACVTASAPWKRQKNELLFAFVQVNVL